MHLKSISRARNGCIDAVLSQNDHRATFEGIGKDLYISKIKREIKANRKAVQHANHRRD
jgi:hypothetical protein